MTSRSLDLAPIALFAYNRPAHLQRTLDALVANPLASSSELSIFLDGPKNEEDRKAQAAIRNMVAGVTGFKSVSLIEHESNRGLAVSIVQGVSSVLTDCERVIVLEDDIVTAPSFLQFMNGALDMYSADEQVASVHGFSYEIDGQPETFFLKGADCWGWATWRRAWQMFSPDGAALLDGLVASGRAKEFDLNGAVENMQMLRDQIDGRNNSWAIRWHASAFLQDKLTLHPGRSLVQNIGLDGSGTHCTNVPSHLKVSIGSRPVDLKRLPVVESAEARERIIKYLSAKQPQEKKRGMMDRLFGAIGLSLKSKRA